MNNKYTLVRPENPIGLHERLHLQQGVFLCPGNMTISFGDNLKALDGWDNKNNVRKIVCRLDIEHLRKALEKCRRMNISRESLFPGLDGFAQSMKYHLHFYRDLFDLRNPKTQNHTDK